MQRKRFTVFSLLLTSAFVTGLVLSSVRTAMAQDVALAANKSVPVLRGIGAEREMLLTGRVLNVDGQSVNDFEISVSQKKAFGRDLLPVKVTGNQLEVWVPIGGSEWFYVELSAASKDGHRRAFVGIAMASLRQSSIDGVDLNLMPSDRTVQASVEYQGAAVANADVSLETTENMVLRSRTDDAGRVTFRLQEREKLRQLSAWTDDFRIGGYSFSRKPRRDPLGTDFTIELTNCRDQKVRFVTEDDGSPIPNLPFDLTLGTGAPNYNFVGVPDSFPHCHMTTDANGEATCRWFPDWKTHGAYAEIGGSNWANAQSNSDWNVSADGVMVMPLRRRVTRLPLVGKVTMEDSPNVAGLMVQIRSPQGEQEGHSDHLSAFTDESGNFTRSLMPMGRC